MEFKDRLRELREGTGKTQTECAKELKVEYANYNKWENGKAPNFETVCHIANFFNTTTDYLLGRSGARYAPEQVKATEWESALLSQTVNILNSFFIRYNAYQEKEKALSIDKVFYMGIKAGIVKALEPHNKMLDFLENIEQYKTIQDIEKQVDEYMDNFGLVNINGFSDFEAELWLREELQNKIPGYSQYREKLLAEWVKDENSKQEAIQEDGGVTGVGKASDFSK